MKIYVGHSTKFDYKLELYTPLKESELALRHELIFPHETEERMNTKDVIKQCDIVLAEVSYPSTGLGIELGWADAFQISIMCIFTAGSQPAESLKLLTSHFVKYEDRDDMAGKITKAILSL